MDAFFQTSKVRAAQVIVTNTSEFAQWVGSGVQLQQAVDTVIEDGVETSTTEDSFEDIPLSTTVSPTDDDELYVVQRVEASEDDDERKTRLLEMVDLTGLSDPKQNKHHQNSLAKHTKPSVLTLENVERQR